MEIVRHCISDNCSECPVNLKLNFIQSKREAKKEWWNMSEVGLLFPYTLAQAQCATCTCTCMYYTRVVWCLMWKWFLILFAKQGTIHSCSCGFFFQFWYIFIHTLTRLFLFKKHFVKLIGRNILWGLFSFFVSKILDMYIATPYHVL